MNSAHNSTSGRCPARSRWHPTWRRFRLTFKGQPIDDLYARLPRGDISHSEELSWALACRWWGAEWAAWEALDSEQAAWRIAVYQAEQMTTAVLAWDRERERKRAEATARARAKQKR
jgi:hypothetical protein